MASPDLNDGYIRYADELDAALAVADYSKAARIVLREVWCQAFGLAARRVVHLSAKTIADHCGKARQYIDRGLQEVIASGLLIASDGGGFTWNKDYETWTRNGSPRFTQAEIMYIKNARSYNREYAYLANRTERIYPSKAPDPDQSTNANAKQLVGYSEQLTSCLASTVDHIAEQLTSCSNSNYPVAQVATNQLLEKSSPYRNAPEEDKKTGDNTPNELFSCEESSSQQATATPPQLPRDDVGVEPPSTRPGRDRPGAKPQPKAEDLDRVGQAVFDMIDLRFKDEFLAERLSASARGLLAEGRSALAAIEAYRLACDNPEVDRRKIAVYASRAAADIDRDLDCCTVPTDGPLARPSYVQSQPQRLTPAEAKRQRQKAESAAKHARNIAEYEASLIAGKESFVG